MGGIAFLFPGQGSQYVGMGSALYERSGRARKVFDEAERITGKPIRRLCFEGSLQELTRTENLQPAVTSVNLAVLELLKERGVEPDCVAGHSLGEYSALYAAGVLGLEDTIRLVDRRGEVMEQAARKQPGSMAALLGLDTDRVVDLVNRFQEHGVLCVANYNAPAQTVISGEKEPVARAGEAGRDLGGKAVTLKVSGAWHSPLMAEAREAFAQYLEAVSFTAPRCRILFNLTAEEESDPARIKDLMARQITESVFWFQTIERMIEKGVDCFVEVGPKNVLSNLMKRILPKGNSCRVFQVDDPAGVEDLVERLGS